MGTFIATTAIILLVLFALITRRESTYTSKGSGGTRPEPDSDPTKPEEML
jgi:hypothetical protein